MRYSAKANAAISKNELLVKTKNQAVSYLLFLQGEKNGFS